MNCGLYKIINTANDKVYIGSSKRLNKRCKDHFGLLRNNKHHSAHLQRAWNKYNESFFIFEIFLYCDKSNLSFYEQRAINEYKSLNGEFGYNCAAVKRTDLTGSNYEEMCQKMSNSRIGKYCGKDSFWYGKKHTKETKRKQSISKIGKYIGKKNPMFGKSGKDSPNYGKKHTEETKEKISKSNKGRKGLSGKDSPNYGKQYTKETRKKISEARIKNEKSKGKNNVMYGKHHSKKSKREISKNRKGKGGKAVIANWKHYNMIFEAAKDLKITSPGITYRIETNKPGYSWA